jgi:hypothetical protein
VVCQAPKGSFSRIAKVYTRKADLLKVIGALHSGAPFDFLLHRLLNGQVLDLDRLVRLLLIFLLTHRFTLLFI